MPGISRTMLFGALLCGLSACNYGVAPEVSSTNAAEPIAPPAATNCDQQPSFVEVYPKAIVTNCMNWPIVEGAHRSTGRMVLVSQDTPQQIKAFYQHSAQGLGLHELMNGRTMYAARDLAGTHRKLEMAMEPDPFGMKIGIDWSQDSE